MSERVNTVVVGASAAGLSTACCLSKEGVEHVVLEKEEHVAGAWRRHYERLHLHTSKPLSALPHRKWGAEIEDYPPRLDVVKYLEAYAKEDLTSKPRFGQNVQRIERAGGGWRTATRASACSSSASATPRARSPSTSTSEEPSRRSRCGAE